jgi:transposase InsO family protein
LIRYNEKFLVKRVSEPCKKVLAMTRRQKIADMIMDNPEVFTGKIGKAKTNEVSLMIDDSVTPVVQKQRRIPVNLSDRAESKIQDLLDQDIIERVPDNQPRSWVSPPVIAPKPDSNDIRFCIDMRMANKAIQRPYTQIPTMADIVSKFQGAERFTKLDLKEAYHQFVLDEQSRNITTFYGPDGLYRYKRLNYGTKSAQDILQLEMHKMLSGIPSQVNIADDILIGGSVEEHDAALQKVLSALTSNGITVNPDKCVFDVEEVRFVGLVFNKQGIKPDPKNVKNLQDASQPTSKVELRSFLGMAGFSERFIPNFASIVHPLRQQLKENIWAWDEKCQEAFTKLQASLSEFSLLHHYVIGHDTELVVDASITGLGAVLVQRASKTEAFHPVMYKSRSLKEVETRYSATEREALAVRWACRKLRKYLLGAPKFRIVTDHRPLTYMFHKLCGELPPRVENFVMDVQEFEYEIVYRPGKTCIADYMSRHHVDRAGSSRVFEIEAAAESVVESGCCHALNEQGTVTVEDIRAEGERCEVYQRLVKAIKSGISDNDEDLKPYMVPEIKHDLSVVSGVVCRGSRVVVPIALQKRVVELSHRAHQGISKAKHFLRTFCWFPGMDKAVENQVRGCLPCQAVQPPNNDQPIKPSELPIGPWQYVEMDFQGPYPNGEYIFIMIDRYSRWPEMAWFRNAPNANTTIAAMEKIFTNKGVPAVCQSDNGSPFQSKEMEQFAQSSGYRHHHITPEWPRANGTVERFNRSMKEALQAATLEGKSLRDASQRFLQMYRSTPHSATGVSPHAALHGGREMRTVLPLMTPTDHVIDRIRDQRYKAKMRNGLRPHKLRVGDSVIVKQMKVNKLTPTFNPTPLRITEVQGSRITAREINGTWTITRDASYFRKIASDTRADNEGDQDASDESDGETENENRGNQQETPDGSTEKGQRPRRTTRRPSYLKDYET